jgi:hypothetical protein
VVEVGQVDPQQSHGSGGNLRVMQEIVDNRQDQSILSLVVR